MHEIFMERCFELASKGMGNVSPNPLVGAVLVQEGKIIGEGFHSAYGKPHAEVEAVASVKDKSLLSSSVLYVNLEPCNHFGKTPPCTDLILENKIPEVVICNQDPNPVVAGKGIARLKENGVNVLTGISEKEGQFLNRRFFTFHQEKRPYVILKWAQTKDGFIDKKREGSEPVIHKISSEESRVLSHQWRTEESAILVGKNTVLKDDPELTARLVRGKNPIRIVLDKNLETPSDAKIYNEKSTTIVFNSIKNEIRGNLRYHQLKDSGYSLDSILAFLYAENIQSILIEGGTYTLQKFIDAGLWDEARIFTAPIGWKEGVKAPVFHAEPAETKNTGVDKLKIYFKK